MAEITIKGIKGNPLNVQVIMTEVFHGVQDGETINEVVDFIPDLSKPVRAFYDCVTARRQYCPLVAVEDNVAYVSESGTMKAGVYTLTIICTGTNGKTRRYKSEPCIEIYDETDAADITVQDPYILNGIFYTSMVQSDWDETNPASPAFILNKPDLTEYATKEDIETIEGEIPVIPEWAQQPQKPTYTAEEVGAVPTSRTVNGKALSEDITLNAQDVGAQAPIADLAQIREGAAKGETAYQKPSTGIAKTDLTNGIQQSLDRADTALQAAALTPLQNQIDTINSKIPTDATSTNELADKNYVERLLNEKQNTINDLDAIRRGAAKGDTAYQLPSNGMPKTDLAVSVQQSLDKANTAYQKPSAGIPKTDLAQDIQDRLDIPIDDEPTAGSNNLVKSGGVKSLVDNTVVAQKINNEYYDKINSNISYTADIYVGKVLDNVGNLIDPSDPNNSTYTKRIYLNKNYRYLHYEGNAGGIVTNLAFYDKDMAFLDAISIKASSNRNVIIDLSNTEYSQAVYVQACSYVNPLVLELYNENDITYKLKQLEQDVIENGIKKYFPFNIPFDNHGYIQSSNGVFVNTENARCSDYIDTRTFDTIEFGSSLSPVGFMLAFYDANKNILSDISIAGTNAFVERIIDLSNTTYSDVAFVRYSQYGLSILSSCYCHFYNIKYNVDFRLESIDNKVEPIERSVKEYLPFNIPLNNHGYIQSSNGVFVNTKNARCSDYINIAGYTYIRYVSNINSAGAEIAFYDINKNYLSDISIAGDNNSIEKKIDLSNEQYINVAYIRFSFYGLQYINNVYCIIYNKDDITSKTWLSSFYLPKVGLKCLVFGDSITTSASITVGDGTVSTAYQNIDLSSAVNPQGVTISYRFWPMLINKYMSFSDLRNYAYSGASYTDNERSEGNERQNLSYQVTLAINDKNNPNGIFPTSGTYNPDIVIFALGTNDGTPNDTAESAMAKTVVDANGNIDIPATLAALDRTNFCEAARWSFLTIRKEWPDAQCFCVLPIQRASSYLISTYNELEKMANYYGMVVIDGAKDAGIIKDLELNSAWGTFLKDGLHPNGKGQNMLARLIMGAIKKNYLDSTYFNEE